MPEPVVNGLVLLAISTAVAVIAYFLRETMNELKENGDEIKKIKENYATQSALDRVEKSTSEQLGKIEREVKTDANKFQSEVNGKLDAIQADLKEVQVSYIPKEEFFGEIAKLDKKLDRMMDLIIDGYKCKKD